jgi:hypothetical protein
LLASQQRIFLLLRHAKLRLASTSSPVASSSSSRRIIRLRLHKDVTGSVKLFFPAAFISVDPSRAAPSCRHRARPAWPAAPSPSLQAACTSAKHAAMRMKAPSSPLWPVFPMVTVVLPCRYLSPVLSGGYLLFALLPFGPQLPCVSTASSTMSRSPPLQACSPPTWSAVRLSPTTLLLAPFASPPRRWPG